MNHWVDFTLLNSDILRETKTRFTNRVRSLRGMLEESAAKRAELQGSAFGAEDTCREMDRILGREERRRDTLQWDLDRYVNESLRLDHKRNRFL